MYCLGTFRIFIIPLQPAVLPRGFWGYLYVGRVMCIGCKVLVTKCIQSDHSLALNGICNSSPGIFSGSCLPPTPHLTPHPRPHASIICAFPITCPQTDREASASGSGLKWFPLLEMPFTPPFSACGSPSRSMTLKLYLYFKSCQGPLAEFDCPFPTL